MSLRDEFIEAQSAQGYTPFAFIDLSGKLARLSIDLPNLMRDIIQRQRAGENIFMMSEKTTSFRLDLPHLGYDDLHAITGKRLEEIPGYRSLVETLSRPDIDIAFHMSFRRREHVKIPATVEFFLMPDKPFTESSVKLDEFEWLKPVKDGPPAWVSHNPAKPKLKSPARQG